MPSKELLAYLAALSSVALATAAAFLQGGWVAGLGAAAAGMASVASVLGVSVARAGTAPK